MGALRVAGQQQRQQAPQVCQMMDMADLLTLSTAVVALSEFVSLSAQLIHS